MTPMMFSPSWRDQVISTLVTGQLPARDVLPMIWTVFERRQCVVNPYNLILVNHDNLICGRKGFYRLFTFITLYVQVAPLVLVFFLISNHRLVIWKPRQWGSSFLAFILFSCFFRRVHFQNLIIFVSKGFNTTLTHPFQYMAWTRVKYVYGTWWSIKNMFQAPEATKYK